MKLLSVALGLGPLHHSRNAFDLRPEASVSGIVEAADRATGGLGLHPESCHFPCFADFFHRRRGNPVRA